MSKYTLQKNEYSVDVIRNSDNHAHSFMCSDVLPDPDLLYIDKQTDAFGNTIEADELPEGKNFGDVNKVLNCDVCEKSSITDFQKKYYEKTPSKKIIKILKETI